ncbi:hypothetical protein NNRS527_02004 [Nitrosospira sp. NRS527]|nr:hypothetical protein NNRS527_02004 [Nitrosospira sp. NRS527]
MARMPRHCNRDRCDSDIVHACGDRSRGLMCRPLSINSTF